MIAFHSHKLVKPAGKTGISRAHVPLVLSEGLVAPPSYLLDLGETLHRWVTQLRVENKSADKLSLNRVDSRKCQALAHSKPRTLGDKEA